MQIKRWNLKFEVLKLYIFFGDALSDCHFPKIKTGKKNYQFPNRLLTYVIVHFGPVDTTMRIKVWDDVAMSHSTVTNHSLLAEIEMRCNVIASGNFNFLYNVLSNFD